MCDRVDENRESGGGESGGGNPQKVPAGKQGLVVWSVERVNREQMGQALRRRDPCFSAKGEREMNPGEKTVQTLRHPWTCLKNKKSSHTCVVKMAFGILKVPIRN